MAQPYALSPTVEAIVHGVSVRNADSQPVFRTVTVRGAPVVAAPAMSQGLTLVRTLYTLNETPITAASLRQTDRFIVVLSGTVADGTFRRLMVNDPLPAGVEIEAPVLREDVYPFLGALTKLLAHEQRDDRFFAAFNAGADGNSHETNDDARKPLGQCEFRVAYVAQAVTPGHFVHPEAVIEDMYHPRVMTHTDGGQFQVTPR